MRVRLIVLLLLLFMPLGTAGCGRGATATATAIATEPQRTAPQEGAVTEPAATRTVPAAAPAPPTHTPALEATTKPSPSLGTSGGVIAFNSERDGNSEIYIMNADGSGAQRLTHNPAYDAWPTWSPDGSQIAFVSDRSGNPDIYVMDADGTSVRQLTQDGAEDIWPEWSPDGTRIVFPSRRDGNFEIYVIGVDGADLQRLTNTPAAEDFPAWSPDGTQIAFSRVNGDHGTYVMRADGSGERKLMDIPALESAWSPDGTRIAFASDHEGFRGIYVMDAAGGDLRNLSSTRSGENCPDWSPDGTQMVFASWRDGDGEINVMDAEGGNLQKLTDNRYQDEFPAWRPAVQAATSDTWIRSYEDRAIGTALDGVLTMDGGYLLVGSTHYTHHNRDDEDVYLMETDAVGEPRWEKTLGGDRFDRGNRIIPAADGGFAVLGETRSFGAGERDIYLLKIDSDARELWSRVYGGAEEETGFDIRATADGGYILTGQTASFGAGGTDVYLVKTDAQGTEEWSRTFGGAGDEEGYAAVELPEGGFLVLGVALHEGWDYVAMDPDIYLIRTDELGDELWSQVREEPGAQSGHRLLATSDGHFLVTGLVSAGGGSAGIDPLILKIDADGNEIWNQAVGEADSLDYGTDVVETGEGGYLLTGMSERSQGGIPLIKVDQNGEVLWREHLSDARGNRAGLRILESPAGGYVIIGTVSDGGEGWYTLLIGTNAARKADMRSPAATASLAGSTHSLVLLGTLIDGTGAEPLPDAALVIQGERVVAVGPRTQVDVPPDAQVINLPGATILPGLINTHVHNAYKVSNLKIWAEAGVTTVRDLGAPYGGNYLARRDRLGDDHQRARLVAAGPLVTVPGGYPIAGNDFPSLTVTSPEDAREKINQLIEDGADVIKITLTSGSAPSLSAEEAAAIVETAHARGIPVTAHATTAEDLERALDAGVDDVAHIATDRVSNGLIRRIVAADVSWVPTLAILQGRGAGNLRRFLKAGGRVALGNDAGYLDGVKIGLPVHEIEQLEEAGMTPMQIIVAATRNAAHVCRLEDQLGTLEAGKIADVLVVAGDPLEDINALQDVLLVVHQGVIIRQED